MKITQQATSIIDLLEKVEVIQRQKFNSLNHRKVNETRTPSVKHTTMMMIYILKLVDGERAVSLKRAISNM